jgi:hypothetical protein
MNIQWEKDEWKRHIVVVKPMMTDMIMKMTVMMLSTVYPESMKEWNTYFPPTHLPSSYLPSCLFPPHYHP